MAPRIRLPLLLAVLALGLAACGDEQIVTYKAPKEKDPELPAGAAAAASAQPPAPDASPGAGMPGAPMSGPAAGPMAGATMAGTPVQTASGVSLVWTAPQGWAPNQGSAMRKATYAVPGAGAAELVVTAFPGDVGGEVANVNRWRGQVGLQAVSAVEASGALTRIEANGLSIAVLDVSATASAGDHRIIGAMVPFSGSTWFFKMSGPGATLGAAKPAFLAFLKTVRAP